MDMIEEIDPDWFHSESSKEKHEQFMRQVFEVILKDAVFEGTARDAPVVQWMEPEDLKSVLGCLPERPQCNQRLVDLLKLVIHYSVKTGHPRFINQLFSGLVVARSFTKAQVQFY